MTIHENIMAITNSYQLSPTFKIVNGLRSCCLINIQRGEFVLVNHSAAQIFKAFEKARSCDEVFSLTNVPDVHRDQVEDFLKQCIASDILIGRDSQKDPIKLELYANSHISDNKLSVVLELTTKCNLYCQHCYNDSGRRHVCYFPFDKIDALFAEIVSARRELSTLTITGGEPFLYPNLINVLRIARSYGFPTIRINTNGTIFEDDVINKIDKNLKNIILIQVTLLGAIKNTHDEMSHLHGSFNKTINNITRFKNRGFNVGVSFIRSKYSEREINDVFQLGKFFGVKISIGDIFPIGRAFLNFRSIEVTSNQTDMHVICDANYYGGATAGLLSDDKKSSLVGSFPPDLPCGKNTLAIKSNGDVIPCMLLQQVVVGNIFSDPLNVIMNSSRLANFREKSAIENREVCSSCELRYVCSNKCPAVSLAYGGDIGTKNPFCRYY